MMDECLDAYDTPITPPLISPVIDDVTNVLSGPLVSAQASPSPHVLSSPKLKQPQKGQLIMFLPHLHLLHSLLLYQLNFLGRGTVIKKTTGYNERISNKHSCDYNGPLRHKTFYTVLYLRF